LPTRQVDDGHSDASLQEPRPLHVTSQLHALPHFVRRLHESAPLHVTSHGAPAGHWTSSAQESSPAQSTSHDVAIVQLIL